MGPSQYDYHYDESYSRSQHDIRLAQEIHKAINGEYSAIACYERLATMAPTEAVRNQLLEIRQDEIHHFEEFCRIYNHITGRAAHPQITETCPNTYSDGIEFAFKDEQETVDFYLSMADVAKNILIKKAFKRAAADEQNHAVWFLYFIQKNK
ncbi:ferritin-like domain-containing protein [Bacillus sp. PS06]|uniref:ferritin-like domain-containing protein n=1 Tax=Bacillus sp. PS06 TaxID=2764176 RepID=UPI001784934B|nr:ferritin-like domain-containing protein [Bacillus sp. PS06]MBD8068669.1 ferritin-like domain-containing protein [Bacillus sp. PS06]